MTRIIGGWKGVWPSMNKKLDGTVCRTHLVIGEANLWVIGEEQCLLRIRWQVLGTTHYTVLKVPSSKGSRLLKDVVRIEPRLARSTGYQAKLVEKGERPLAKFICLEVLSPRCYMADYIPCKNQKVKGSSLCMTKNIVYEGTCDLCETEYVAHPIKPCKGIHIGQSYRKLYKCVVNMPHPTGGWKLGP